MVGLLSKLTEVDKRLALPTERLCQQVQLWDNGLAANSSLIPLPSRRIATPTTVSQLDPTTLRGRLDVLLLIQTKRRRHTK